MKTYIAILRGINVGGKKRIQMADLATKLQALKYKCLRSYIQSGNLVFKTKELPNDVVAEKLKNTIEIEFGFNVPVIVLKQNDWNNIIDKNPFAHDKNKDSKHLYICFLSSQPQPNDIHKLDGFKDKQNEFSIGNKTVYLYCPNGYSKTKLTNNYLEKKLRVTATTRNWKTTLKLAQIANE